MDSRPSQKLLNRVGHRACDFEVKNDQILQQNTFVGDKTSIQHFVGLVVVSRHSFLERRLLFCGAPKHFFSPLHFEVENHGFGCPDIVFLRSRGSLEGSPGPMGVPYFPILIRHRAEGSQWSVSNADDFPSAPGLSG